VVESEQNGVFLLKVSSYKSVKQSREDAAADNEAKRKKKKETRIILNRQRQFQRPSKCHPCAILAPRMFVSMM